MLYDSKDSKQGSAGRDATEPCAKVAKDQCESFADGSARNLLSDLTRLLKEKTFTLTLLFAFLFEWNGGNY